jgi:hypothetical protein
MDRLKSMVLLILLKQAAGSRADSISYQQGSFEHFVICDHAFGMDYP